jgi:cysteine synthase A
MHSERRNTEHELAQSVLDLIGETPMLELHRLVDHFSLEGRLLLKVEMNNPGLSKKDRVALAMIRAARREGRLAEGQTVVEVTSGNTGTGLALVCAALGHPFVAVMSRGNTPERAVHMHALGAEVVLVDQLAESSPGLVTGEDLKRVEAEADRITAERGAFRAGQFSNVANLMAHETTTGPEIWRQSGESVDVYVDCPGTSGSFSGVSRFLKSRNPEIRCYVVEPARAAVLEMQGRGAVDASGGHRIQGAGYARTDDDLPLFDRSLADGYLKVSDEEAIAAARILARTEGILGGFSTGAHLAAAIGLLKGRERGRTVALLACDSGLKYLSTDLFERVD